jgi:membrane-associated phospholipid phosphatase
MEAITHWVGNHALALLAGLALLGAAAGFLHWRGRPPWSDDIAVPLLHRRYSIWLLVAGLAGFVLIAVAIPAEGRLVAWDLRITNAVREAIGAPALRVLAALSELGAPDVLTAFGVLVASGLLLTGHRLLGVSWIVTALGSGFLISLAKNLFERPRPVHGHGFAMETSWSFPSGHAAGSLVFYGMLAYIMMVRAPARWHVPILVASLGLVFAIGATRVLLQVHYLSDVAAGYAVGLAWLALCVMTTEFLRTAHRPRTDPTPSQRTPD